MKNIGELTEAIKNFQKWKDEILPTQTGELRATWQNYFYENIAKFQPIKQDETNFYSSLINLVHHHWDEYFDSAEKLAQLLGDYKLPTYAEGDLKWNTAISDLAVDYRPI